MLNLIQMMTMRVEPPKEGIGRVHRLSEYASPTKTPAKPIRSDNPIKVRSEAINLSILRAIAKGTSLRENLAEQCGVSKTTITNHCNKLVKEKLIRVTKNGHENKYRVTSVGMTKIESSGEEKKCP